MDIFECQWFLVQNRLLAGPGVFPCRDIRELVVIPQRLSFGSLVLLPEMAAARLVALQCVEAHQFSEFQEVGDASGILESLIQLLAAAKHSDILPELFAQRWNTLQRLLQSSVGARHATFIPQ